MTQHKSTVQMQMHPAPLRMNLSTRTAYLTITQPDHYWQPLKINLSSGNVVPVPTVNPTLSCTVYDDAPKNRSGGRYTPQSSACLWG